MARFLRVAAAAAAVGLATASAPAATGPRVLFPWLCLERCGDDASNITAEIAQLAANAPLFTGAAFEMFNLGPNSTLILNNLSRVGPALKGAGIGQRYAMISSYPYPPQFLTYMRQLFANPAPFIATCVAALQADPSLTAFNIDWEPTSGDGAPTPTAADAVAYAAFLDTFAKALHAAGPYQLSVAVATWSPIWNLTLLGATDVDLIAHMGTYVGNWTTWQKQFAELIAAVPLSKVVVGLETTDDDDGGRPFTTAELAQRFGALQAAGVRAVGIWKSPIPDNWWPFLKAL